MGLPLHPRRQGDRAWPRARPRTVSLKLARELRDQHEQALAQGPRSALRSGRSARRSPRHIRRRRPEDLIATRRQQWRANATTVAVRARSQRVERVHLIGACKPIASRPGGGPDRRRTSRRAGEALFRPRPGATAGLAALEAGWSGCSTFAKAHGWRTPRQPGRPANIFEHILQVGRSARARGPMHPALDWREMPAFMVQAKVAAGRPCRVSRSR